MIGVNGWLEAGALEANDRERDCLSIEWLLQVHLDPSGEWLPNLIESIIVVENDQHATSLDSLQVGAQYRSRFLARLLIVKL